MDLDILKDQICEGNYHAGYQYFAEGVGQVRLAVSTEGGAWGLGGFSFWIAIIQGEREECVLGFWDGQYFSISPDIAPINVIIPLLEWGKSSPDQARLLAGERFNLIKRVD